MAKKQHNAAFINVIAEEGTKEDAILHLQDTWSDLVNLQKALIRLGFNQTQINQMTKTGTLGKVF